MSEKDYEAYAIRLLPGLYDSSDFGRVQQALKDMEYRFLKISGDDFGLEFLTMKLALACRSWDHACGENGVEDEADQKALLKVIMNSFQSPKFLKIAETFSDYLHTENAETQPWLSMPALFFKRLKMEALVKKDGKEDINPAFQLLVELADSFRSEFENDFFEFVNQTNN
jgi:hypothetical protein